MDYFSPRTPALLPKGNPAERGSSNGAAAGSPSYFDRAGGVVVGLEDVDSGEGGGGAAASSASSTTTKDVGGPLPTPNPFKLGGAQPTAFPVQNGATLAFQQALLQRHGSSAGTGQLTAALPTPQGRKLQRTTSTTAGAGNHHHPFSTQPTRLAAAPVGLGKSPRTPSISSPRKMESVSPPSSPDQHHSSPRKVPHGYGSHTARKSPRSPPHSAAAAGAASGSNSNGNSGFDFQAALASQQPLQTPSLKLPNLAQKATSSSASRAGSLPNPAAGIALRQGGVPMKCNTTGPSACAPTSSIASRRGAQVQNSRFKAISVPVDLARILSETSGTPHSDGNLKDESDVHARNKKLLILDMRPHTSFVTQGRFKGAINVCVPSTLLRRPNFGLQKIADTLGSRTDKDHFMHALELEPLPAKIAKVDRILLLDQDLSILTADSVIHALLAKIEKSPFSGELYWLKGGWNLTDKCVDSPAKVAKTDEEMKAASALDEYIDWHELREGEGESESEDDEMEVEKATESSGDSLDQATPQERPRNLSLPFDTSAGGAALGRSNSGSGSSSFASSSADSLCPSSYASSSTSLSGESGGKTPSLQTFDSSKMKLPDLRNTASPAESSLSPTPAGVSDGSRPTRSVSNTSGAGSSAPVLRPRKLPMSAFQFGSTAAGASAADGDRSRRGSAFGASTSDSRPSSTGGTRESSPSRTLTKLATRNSPGSVQGKEEYGASASTGKSRRDAMLAGQKKAAANPFFDNIRQNVESTSLKETLAHIKPLHFPEEFVRPALQPRLPSFLQRLVKMSPQARSEKLHAEYFELEQLEQKRLQKVLDWHCQQSAVVEIENPDEGTSDSAEGGGALTRKSQSQGPMKMDGYHPFSISAGVEKGHLNRYKNIWPYEHARVRVNKLGSPTCGDYINASHIQLRGSDKTYIASQGPLESTTEHFWKLVLQENVNVIVMLTLLAEGGRDKCSNYFRTADHGSISVTMVEERGDLEARKASTNQEVGFFAQEDLDTANDLLKHQESQGVPSLSRDNSQKPPLDSTTVRRTLHVLDRSDPLQKEPRTIRHIQYIRWPDFDIPPDTDCLLELINETSRAQEELTASDAPDAPVLVHCSAGVGRTGTFIAVDTLLDRYRQERRAKESGGKVDSPDAMQVDAQPEKPRNTSRSRRTASNASASERILSMTLDSDSEASPTVPSNPTFPSSTSMSSKNALDVSSQNKSTNPSGDLIQHLNRKGLQPEDRTDPVKSLVDQMREQRMNSVANAGQYLFTHLALYAGIIADLKREGVNI